MVIPLIIMGAISAVSFLPSLFPQSKEARSEEVINQTGKKYFSRQTWRTNGKEVYSRPPISKPQKQTMKITTIIPFILIGVLGLVIVRKVL
tara:strand:- start:1174 stop:1446 length:273 start_codon:yes stop_codon:yes gene_type:complete